MTETTTQSNELATIIETSGLEKTKAQVLLDNFSNFFAIASDWETKANALEITDISQKAEMKMAREGRLFLRSKRIEVENTRKKLKEDSLREGQTIDAIAKILKNLIEPIEENLEKKEKYAEIQEAKIKAELKAKREVELTEFDAEFQFVDLANMPEEAYEKFLASAKIAQAQRIEAERKANEERIAKEKAEAEERERIKLENEKLKKDAEEREKVLAEERKKAELEKKALEEAAAKERAERLAEENRVKAEHEAKLKKEREEREKVEAELKAKKEEEVRLKLEAEAKAEFELSKGDKEKFDSLISDLESLKGKYSFKSKKFVTLQNSINELLDKTITYANSKK